MSEESKTVDEIEAYYLDKLRGLDNARIENPDAQEEFIKTIEEFHEFQRNIIDKNIRLHCIGWAIGIASALYVLFLILYIFFVSDSEAMLSNGLRWYEVIFVFILVYIGTSWERAIKPQSHEPLNETFGHDILRGFTGKKPVRNETKIKYPEL